MAKKKPVTVVEKIVDAVDKALHPDHAEGQEVEQKNKAPKIDVEAIQEHRKFDKFK